MRPASALYAITFNLVLVCWGCQEIHPLKPPKDPPLQTRTGDTCQPPAITQNIVGTWHFESTYNIKSVTEPGFVNRGSITFNPDGSITDPDSLFENHIVGQLVTSRTYVAEMDSPFPEYKQKIFNVYLKTKRGTQENYFTVVNNECNKIHISLFLSENNKIGFFLTR